MAVNACKEHSGQYEGEVISSLCHMGIKFAMWVRNKHEPNADSKACYCCNDIVYSNNPKLGPVIFYYPVCNS